MFPSHHRPELSLKLLPVLTPFVRQLDVLTTSINAIPGSHQKVPIVKTKVG